MKYRLGLGAEPLINRIDPRLEGVGMIRSEYICRLREEYVTLRSCRKAIASYVSNICKLFYPNEVWYRTTEMIVPEVNVLNGADHIFEEQYYTYGLRGVRRGLCYPETFLLELQCISDVAKEFNNLHVLFPYVTMSDELEKCIELLKKCGFSNKYGMMAEIPSALIMINKFLDLGVSHVTFGMNDLSGLILGTNRGKDVDRVNPAVLESVRIAIDKVHQRNIPVSIGGYVNKQLEESSKAIGADYFIVHYTNLPEVMGVPHDKLPHLSMLREIKNLTKKRRNEREINLWRSQINELDQQQT